MLAIVIPYYKIDFFEETLKSLFNQENKDFHVYIGNDASKDDPSHLISKYESDLSITYKRFEENFGSRDLTAQWDRCIDMIGDESWIMILGDDDYLGPDAVSSFYSHIAQFRNDCNLIRFASKILYSDNSTSEKFIHPDSEYAGKAFLRRYYGTTRSSLSEYIFRRETYEKYGFYNYPLAWHSDDRAWLEFSEGKPICSINKAVVYFRHSQVHISSPNAHLKQKEEASSRFYRFLATREDFSKKHRLLFARNFERYSEKNGHLRFRVWLQLFFIYILNFESTAFKNFLKRFVTQKPMLFSIKKKHNA